MPIDTKTFSQTLRAKAIDLAGQRLLITDFQGTEQESDLSEPPNCGGYGRIRTFRRKSLTGWIDNPLPIDPASNRLGLSKNDILKAQVYQNAVCNWRCWYCFVPFELLSGNLAHSKMLGVSEILDLYQNEANPPSTIDLTGGQPDLTPEWIPWMMGQLKQRGLERQVYLWSDDNLSNDYFWQFLSQKDIGLIREYRNYGKVCCFKGFNAESFAFNTGADEGGLERQFSLFQRYLDLKIDLYAYATFTTPKEDKIQSDMSLFIDRLQSISHYLPLRVIPLEIMVFSPVVSRIKHGHSRAMDLQWQALSFWQEELSKRFSNAELTIPVYDVVL